MKKNIISGIIACIILLFIVSTVNAQAKSEGLAAVKKQMEKTNALYFDLFSKRDLAIVKLYTDDASLLAPNTPPIRGKAAFEKDFKDTYAAAQVKGVKFATENIYGDGTGYITEEGSWQVFDLNGKVLDDGKYLKLWKKTGQGWKIFRDIFNSGHKGK